MNIFPVVIIALMVIFNGSYADQIPIPSWVKDTAKWWSEGQVGDSDFIKGMQYMIQQQIIQIPTTLPSSNTQTQIPMWVKNMLVGGQMEQSVTLILSKEFNI